MKKQEIVLTKMTEARTVGEYLPLSAISVMPGCRRSGNVQKPVQMAGNVVTFSVVSRPE